MAFPIGFKEANDMLLKPPGMQNCNDLEIARGVYPDGSPFIVSRWQLEDRDLEEMKRNGYKLYVIFCGQTQPPMIMVAEKPFKEGG